MRRIFAHGRWIPLPTVRAILCAAMGIPVAVLWGGGAMLLLDAGILFLMVLDIFLIFRNAEMKGERNFPQRLSQGVPQEILITLKNAASNAQTAEVRDSPPLGWPAAPVLKGVVQGRSGLRLSYTVLPPERGVYTFGPIHLRVRCPLGFALRPMRLHASETVKVYPSLPSLRCPELTATRRMARHWGLRSIKWRGEGREFETLREYVEGDDPRKIHWKATARFDRPIVQELRPEKNQIVMMLVDSGRLMSAVTQGKTKLDHALEATVHLAHAALAAGDQVGILAFADRVISFVPPKKTPEQFQMILEGTLDLHPRLVESQYEQALLWLRSRIRRRSFVVIFTDLLDEVVSENLLSAVALLRPRHLPLCVTIRESEWDNLLNRPPSSVKGVYERAVLQETLRQRRKGLRNLVQRGAMAVDLPPAILTAQTLERYLEVKRKGLL